jgi:hypothetical protein
VLFCVWRGLRMRCLTSPPNPLSSAEEKGNLLFVIIGVGSDVL